MGIGTWRQMHPNPIGTPDIDGGIGDFQHQPGTIRDRAAILVGAVVGAVLQELIRQIAVRTMDLNTVEAGLFRILRAAAVIGDDAGYLGKIERARRDEWPLWPDEADMAVGGNGAGRHRQRAVQEYRIGNAADMP